VLIVTHADFGEQRYQLSLKPREEYNLEVALTLRPVQESVNVEASMLPSVHSPGSTYLGGARLAEIPLTQRTNLPDAIVTAAPGMIRGHDDFVHIRGHEVALNPFINGVQFWENAHSVFSPGLGVDYIESMNVMTGGYSSLILKLPAKRLTLVLLANSDGLCSPFDLSTGDVTKSLFALVFLRLFA